MGSGKVKVKEAVAAWISTRRTGISGNPHPQVAFANTLWSNLISLFENSLMLSDVWKFVREVHGILAFHGFVIFSGQRRYSIKLEETIITTICCKQL